MESAVKKNPAYPGLVLERSDAIPVSEARPGKGVKAFRDRFADWETWDWRIKYLIIAPAWIWFCLRARSLWFFTASNPSLTFGGFDGESKREMYLQLPPAVCPRSIFPSRHTTFDQVMLLMKDQQFRFPVAVKPDVGKMGFMFRKINSFEQLKEYHEKIQADYVVQEWIDLPIEVSVFYYRLPYAQKGVISAFVRKDFLEVTGDGRSTLWELITRYPRVRFRLDEMRAKHMEKLTQILAPGERYCLSPALNLSRGGKLVSLEDDIDENLLKVFDSISHYTGNFFYGRYDIKCKSIEDLKQQKNFSILEYNGSGAEPHHVYGNGYSLWQACGILVAHWRILCCISMLNHKSGTPYWEFRRGWSFLKTATRHQKRLKELDRETAHN